MYYCAESCNKLCDSCGKCFDGVCECFCEACEGCSKCIGEVFSRPFSFCVFLAVLFCVVPGGAGIYGYMIKESPSCDPDPSIQCLVSGLNLFLIFCFCVYCCCTLGKEYDPKKPTRYAGGKMKFEKNMCDRIYNIICYDPCFCIFVFLFVFFFVWCLYGFWLTSQIKTSDICRDKSNNALMIKIAVI